VNDFGPGVTDVPILAQKVKGQGHRSSKTFRKWRTSRVHVYLRLADCALTGRPAHCTLAEHVCFFS